MKECYEEVYQINIKMSLVDGIDNSLSLKNAHGKWYDSDPYTCLITPSFPILFFFLLHPFFLTNVEIFFLYFWASLIIYRIQFFFWLNDLISILIKLILLILRVDLILKSLCITYKYLLKWHDFRSYFYTIYFFHN